MDVLGIPTRGAVDGSLDTSVIIDIQNFVFGTLNIYFDNIIDGKLSSGTTNGIREMETEMTFWSLQGASEQWWQSDLKIIQSNLEAELTARTVSSFN